VVTHVVRTVRVEPGDSLPYQEADWRDALVTVESGELELVMACGRSSFFQPGDLLWLQGLPLASLRNRGDEPTVLVAASRDPELR
jgi:quercetin dioxygenase-like cupin family protein